MSEKQKLVIVIGSVREGRFGPVAASWVAGRATAHGGFDVTVVDLADYEIPLALPAAPPKFAGASYPRPAGMAALTSRLDEADAFISASSVTVVRPAAATRCCTWRMCSPSCTR
jgi:NAD(P)H-dependent FMN reductase